MSRIGRQPIEIPNGVDVKIEGEVVTVKGPKGELQQGFSPELSIERGDSELLVQRPSDRGDHRALHGLTRSLILSGASVTGVT